jgi:excisionase family DNA binding protein
MTDTELPKKELLLVKEVAEYLRVSRRKVYKLIEFGCLPAEKYGRGYRVPRRGLVVFRLNSKYDPLS